MTDALNIAIAQLNPTVGDVAGNLAKVRPARAEAAKQGADARADLGTGAVRAIRPRTWC